MNEVGAVGIASAMAVRPGKAAGACAAATSAPRCSRCWPRRPGHGYDVMQTLEEKTGGAWRPSPGSVYPTLQLLEDEGLVRSVERDGKRIFEITDDGRTEVDRRVEEAGGLPWELAGRTGGRGNELRDAIGMLFLAAKQVTTTGDPGQAERALDIVNDARKKLYQLLADD